VGAGAGVEGSTGDNRIRWGALASGESDFTVSELTTHTETAVELARIFTGADIRVDATENGARIRINGIGLRNPHLG